MRNDLATPDERRLFPKVMLAEVLFGGAMGFGLGSWNTSQVPGLDRSLAAWVIWDRVLRGAMGSGVGLWVSDRVCPRPQAWVLGGMMGMMVLSIPVRQPIPGWWMPPLLFRVVLYAIEAGIAGVMMGVVGWKIRVK